MNQNGIPEYVQVTHRQEGKRKPRNEKQIKQKTNGRFKVYHTNNYFKCKLLKCTN